MKEALFYKKLEDKKVQCELCPHNCLILDGRRGVCGVRENRGGALYSLVYGRVCSAHIDPVEKKPLFHFLPGSTTFSVAAAGCNLHCSFCQNAEISQVRGEILGENSTPEEIVGLALENNCRSISYTYTEPTIFYELAYDTAKLAKAKGLKNIFVTNGFINLAPLEMVAPYLDAANVDLKSFREEFYHKICGARLAPVLETLKLMKKLKLWVEVTTLVIPGLNDSPEELADISSFIKNELGEETPWHVSAFHPTYKMLDRPHTMPEVLVKAREIGAKAGLKYIYVGNVFIPGSADTFCGHCKKSLVARNGYKILKHEAKLGKCPFCLSEISGVWI